MILEVKILDVEVMGWFNSRLQGFNVLFITYSIIQNIIKSEM